jgi:predicted permease
MNHWTRIRCWARAVVQRSRVEREMDAELRFHVEAYAEDLVRSGVERAEALRRARLEFGGVEQTKEICRDARALNLVENVIYDLRFAARRLRRTPTFTITALITLVLAISANVVVFGALNALVLKPLDVPEPGELYNVVHETSGYENQSYPDYVDFRSRNTTFRELAAYRIQNAGLTAGNAAYKCWYYRVSGNYFDMLGVQPTEGRVFHAADEHGPNSAPYIVLSNDFWRNHFGADRRMVGTTVLVNKHPFTVIGIAPRGFHGTDLFIWPDFWMPIVDSPDDEGTGFLTNRSMHNIWILGKLKPGISPKQATDNLNVIAGELKREFPSSDDDLSARLAKPGLMGDVLGNPIRSFLAGVMALAFLVLLAACANLASLFAARTADASRELAIRLAMGSGRWRVLRQLIAEALVISVVGGAVGTIFSALVLRALTRWQPFPEFPMRVTVSADAKVYFVALLLSLGSGLLCGLVPLRQVWGIDLAQAIKSGVAGTMVFRRFAFRDVLLGIQIALCTLLVTASIVALRGMQRSLNAPLGFQPQGVMLAETDLHMGGYHDNSATQMQKRMLQQAALIPGVTAVGAVDETPLGTGVSSTTVYRKGTSDFRASNSVFGAKYFSISPGYLNVTGTHLLSGRDFTWHDDAKAPKVAMVNETFAREMFGETLALGQQFMLGDKVNYEIVGVVENGKYDSLTESPWAAMFFPLEQNPDTDTTLMVRSHLPAGEIASELNQVLAAIDPSVPFTLHSWEDELAFVLFPARMATASLGVMGLLAAMLAVTGIFGMAMYSVSKRIKELGIRVALGAQPVKLMGAALGRPLLVLIAGSAAGLLLGVIASQLLAQIVYQATSRDPIVFAGVMMTMAVLGFVAVCIPAHRALSIDPASLLRDE